ncbi:hypothetical protein D3C85_1917430 [compost metagenome]
MLALPSQRLIGRQVLTALLPSGSAQMMPVPAWNVRVIALRRWASFCQSAAFGIGFFIPSLGS